jgi:acetyl esterase/lipase
MKKLIFFILMFRLSVIFGQVAPAFQITVLEDIYKKVDSVELKIYIHNPENMENRAYPAIVFFFGGGWISGSVLQFQQHAAYFAARGMVCVLADYRVQKHHGVTPFVSLGDAKSVMRFLRSNAGKYHINPDKIVASGGSAGGHLAAATAIIERYNDKQDNPDISASPNALILFNPVIDNGPGGYGYDRIGEEYLYFSPIHQLRKGMPPTIFFLGSADDLIPVETAQYFKKIMERTGNRCDLHIYEGQKHGFFNTSNPEYFRLTVEQADEFLVSIGFLSKSE